MIEPLAAVFLAALAAPFLVRTGRRFAPWILAAVPAAAVSLMYLRYSRAGAEVLVSSLAWTPELGVDIALRLDGLSMLMALLIGWIGGFVVLHAGSYLSGHPQLGRFYLFLLTFIAAMLGLVLSDNVLLLFLCWELTSITSYFLIGFKHKEEYARSAAHRALVTTGAGGLALLGGLVLLIFMGQRAGLTLSEASSFTSLLGRGEALRADSLYPAALLLILLGCFTKSAQVPFHHWLPAAMAGPTPVSALLHSATMVKAGVFLLARLHPALGGTPLWIACLTLAGAATMVTGAVLAVGKRDLKSLLAYTTVSALGTLILLLGIGSKQALAAMVVFLTVHALYKSSLFLAVGNVDQQAGSRDLARLRGLRRAMPVTAAAALLAAFGKAGAPPALGYLGKKVALQAKLDFAVLSEWLMLAAVVTNILMVAASLAVAVRPFWGRPREWDRIIHEASFPMLLGPAVLSAAGILVGLVPSFFEKGLAESAASVIAGVPVTVTLKIWSGLSLEALALIGTSALAFALGFAVCQRLEWIWRLPALPRPFREMSPTHLHDRGMDLLKSLARSHTEFVQQGRLRIYVAVTILAAVLAAGPWLVQSLLGPEGPWSAPETTSSVFSSAEVATSARPVPEVTTSVSSNPESVAPAIWRPETALSIWPVQIPDLLLSILIASGILAAMAATRPIIAVMAAGIPGLGLALVFARFGGVDLAITQLLVETLLVVLLAAVLHRFPREMKPCRHCWSRWIPAGLGGAMVTGIVLAAASAPRSTHVADSILSRAVPEAFGRNVVNVILVDFRALDTLGEITVVAAAAIGVWVLLQARVREGRP